MSRGPPKPESRLYLLSLILPGPAVDDPCEVIKEEDQHGADMEIQTTRFGTVAIEAEDILDFPAGLLGLESCHRWVLLADARNDALGWLQSVSCPQIALAVVTPRRFVSDYQLRIPRSELAPLTIDDPKDARVLVIVGKNEQAITLNLKAPLVINLQQRLGRQIVASNDLSVQHELIAETILFKKTA